MWCVQCQNELYECTCADLEERMAKLKNAPSFTYRICKKCDKHYQLCKCEKPIWEHSNKKAG